MTFDPSKPCSDFRALSEKDVEKDYCSECGWKRSEHPLEKKKSADTRIPVWTRKGGGTVFGNLKEVAGTLLPDEIVEKLEDVIDKIEISGEGLGRVYLTFNRPLRLEEKKVVVIQCSDEAEEVKEPEKPAAGSTGRRTISQS